MTQPSQIDYVHCAFQRPKPGSCHIVFLPAFSPVPPWLPSASPQLLLASPHAIPLLFRTSLPQPKSPETCAVSMRRRLFTSRTDREIDTGTRSLGPLSHCPAPASRPRIPPLLSPGFHSAPPQLSLTRDQECGCGVISRGEQSGVSPAKELCESRTLEAREQSMLAMKLTVSRKSIHSMQST